MKVIVYHHYGSPDVLSLEEAEKPAPAAGELLVRVHAATVNRTDCGQLRGKPWLARILWGWPKPKRTILGTEFAGVVETVGEGVEGFSPGDRVFGFVDAGLGSQAESLTIGPNQGVGRIPEGVDFSTAAACLEGAHYALNFINKVPLRPGDQVLVNGGTGTIGSALVQLLKHYGAEVTATCRSEHSDIVAALGADRIIPYDQTDFTQDSARFDFVFDAVGKSTFDRCRPLLKPGGVYGSSELGPWAQNTVLPLLTPLFGGKKSIFPFPQDIPRTVALIQELLASQAFKPLIDRTYRLEEVAEAYRYAESGQKVGGLVVAVAGDGAASLS